MIHAIRTLISAAAILGATVLATLPGAAAAADAIPTQTMDPKLRAMLPADIRDSGILKMVTDAHYPPCESFTDDGKTMVGFDPDIWNALGELYGVKVVPSSIDFSGLIPGVQAGRYHVAMECISDSVEREQQVKFVDVMYGTSAVYTMADNATITEDPLSLCGLKTGAQAGFDFLDVFTKILVPHCEKAGKKAFSVAQYPAAADVLSALYSGRIDFALSDAAAVDDIQKNAPKPIKSLSNPLLPKLYVGMVVAKDNDALASALLAGMQVLQSNGTYDKIMDKWKVPLLKLAKPGVNLSTSAPLEEPKP